jgi:hypothetical protein
MRTTPNTGILLIGGVATFSGVSTAYYLSAFLPLVNQPLYGYSAAVLGAVVVNRLIFCVNPGDGNNFAHHLPKHSLTQGYLFKETAHGTGGSLRKVETSIQGDDYFK